MTKENEVKKEKVKQVKNLSLTELKKLNKKLDRKQEVTIFIEDKNADGEIEEIPYKFTYDTHFRQTKQHRILQDVLHFMDVMNRSGEAVEMATAYSTLMIIKHFTNISVPDDIEEAMDVLDVLTDLELLGVIANALPDEEVIKVYETIKTTLKNLNEDYDAYEKEAQELSLESEQVKEALNKDEQ